MLITLLLISNVICLLTLSYVYGHRQGVKSIIDAYEKSFKQFEQLNPPKLTSTNFRKDNLN